MTDPSLAHRRLIGVITHPEPHPRYAAITPDGWVEQVDIGPVTQEQVDAAEASLANGGDGVIDVEVVHDGQHVTKAFIGGWSWL